MPPGLLAKIELLWLIATQIFLQGIFHDEAISIFHRHSQRAMASYVYGVGDPSTPILELEPSEALNCLEWSRRQHGVLAGGGLAGTLQLWDTRAGGSPQAVTDTQGGEGITGLAWLGSKHGTELLVSR